MDKHFIPLWRTLWTLWVNFVEVQIQINFKYIKQIIHLHIHPTIRASKHEGTSVGLSRVPAAFFSTFMLKGSSLPDSNASSSFLSNPVACSRGSGITGTYMCRIKTYHAYSACKIKISFISFFKDKKPEDVGIPTIYIDLFLYKQTVALSVKFYT